MIQSTLGRVFLALVLVVFVLFAFGTQFLTPPGAQGEVAVVNDRRVMSQEVDQARERQIARYAGQVDRKTLEDLIKREDVLDGLIREIATQDAARAAGVIVPAALLQKTIMEIPDFQDASGKFSPSLYQQLVTRNGFANTSAFGDYVENRLLAQQVAGALSDSAFATRQDLEMLTRMGEQRRDVAWAMFSPAQYLAGVAVTDAEVKARYESNAAGYMSEEQFAIEYVELNLADYAADQQVDESEVRAKYDEMVGQAKANAERRIAHILIGTGGTRDDAAAKSRADEVIAKLAAGESFAALAAAYSDDPGSREQGGDLGFIGKGVLEASLDQVAFSQAVGNVSVPVKGADGIHLLKVLEIRDVEVPAFAAARAGIVSSLAKEKARAAFDTKVEELGTVAYESDNLQDPAAKLGLQVRKTGLFGRKGGPGLVANPKVMEEITSDEVLLDGRNSPVITPADGQAVVLRLAEHRVPARRSLDEVAGDIRNALVLEKASAAAAEKATEFRKLIDAGQGADAVAQQLGVALQRAAAIARADQQVPREVAQAAFAVKRPAQGGTGSGLADMNSGGKAVVIVSNIVDGNLLSSPPERIASDRGQLAGQFGNRDMAAWIEHAVAEADVVRLDTPKSGDSIDGLFSQLREAVGLN
jgi:peptidyl-prolyl cis-trans isomerase D